MDSEKRIRRGVAAEQALESPVVSDAFEGVKVLIVNQLEEQQLDGSPEQEARTLELVRRLQTLRGVKRTLQQFVTTGRIDADREDKSV